MTKHMIAVIAALLYQMFGNLSKNTIPRNHKITDTRLSCAKEVVKNVSMSQSIMVASAQGLLLRSLRSN